MKKVEQSVFDVGVYIMQASVVFKVCMCSVQHYCTPVCQTFFYWVSHKKVEHTCFMMVFAQTENWPPNSL